MLCPGRLVWMRRVCWMAAVSCPALAGCDGYISSVVVGELRLLASVRPIDEAIDDPNLAEEQRLKLAFVVRARDYAEGVVGLRVGTSYQTFADLGDGSLGWNLSASRRDAFEPYTWRLPLVGVMPYLGFFDLEQAQAERDFLLEQGYDTLIYEIDAFSTIGRLPDPITSALLRRDLDSLADTVFHELTHNTIFHNTDITFNESVATFVGRTAGLEFLAAEFGSGAPEIAQAQLSYEDQDRFQAFLRWMKDGLTPIYESELSFDEKIARRQEFIESARQEFVANVLPLLHDTARYEQYARFPYNNAFLLAHVRYNTDQDLFAAVHEFTGRNWGETLRIFRDASAAPVPADYLRDLIPR